MTVADIKNGHMEILADYKQKLYREPKLKDLFLELTLRCNENCLHCGSRCGETRSNELTLEQYKDFLTKIKKDFSEDLPRLCITGGEPLLRKDFFDLAEWIHDQGFKWGMTSNGTLITAEVARKLHKTGMSTISISVDGLKEHHDPFRRTPDAYDRTMKGIQTLIDEGGFQNIQITTVANKKTIGSLEDMFNEFVKIDIDSWRLIGIEPIGRALDHPEYMLEPKDQKHLLDFIREKRMEGYPVTYGCSHFLGTDYECEVRDWYFLCNAGIYIAGIMANGDIGSCLDIERRPETIFGNILTDDFTEVWKSGFKTFRRYPGESCRECRKCGSYRFCGGGSWHSWDFDNNRQRICMPKLLGFHSGRDQNV